MELGMRLGRARKIILFVVATLLVVGFRPATHHARAASLLVSFTDANAKPDVVEERTTFEAGGERIPARIFAPRDKPNAPGVVLVHGVHREGIEEVRFTRFARSLATAGVVVFAPAVKDLSDYQIAPRAIDTAGAAVKAHKARVGRAQVGLMGVSFGGGISLLAAADPRFVDDVAFVVAIGAHDDLARVSRFFATNEIEDPAGAVVKQKAHEYGPTVLVYQRAQDFFPADDVEPARDALRLWLWEKRDEARDAAQKLPSPSREKVEKLFAADIASVRDELLSEIGKHEGEMKKVSPHDHLSGLKAHAYLLHGAGDTVIPASETMWLAKDVPAASLRAVLVSPALVHVELAEPSAADKWALVHFMGRVIAEAESTR